MKLTRKILTIFLFFFGMSGPLWANPAAWKVEGEKGSLTILGTMHRLPADADWVTSTMVAALKSSKLLILEVEKNRVADDYLGYLLRQPGIATSRKELSALLEEEDYQAFLERVTAFGYSEDEVRNYRPWFALTLLGRLGGEEIGLEFKLGAEETLTTIAQNNGIETFGLESQAQQTLFFSNLPRKVEVEWLTRSLRRSEEPGVRSARLFDYWINGDLEGIKDQVIGSYKEIPEIYEVFIRERNENWADQLTRMLKDGGDIFVAVGAAHMVGPDSLLKLLEEEGFRVTRIQ